MICKIILLGLLAISVQGIEDSCSTKVREVCGPDTVAWDDISCSPDYSGVKHTKEKLQKYVAIHISQNYQYLLMSSYFKNYIANREGFSKLYRKLADDAWEDSIKLIKYMAKRGFNMNYGLISTHGNEEIASYRMDELSSLAVALEKQKLLAKEAHKIHEEVTKNSKDFHDPELMSFIEEEYAEKHAKTIRDLSGYISDLHGLIHAYSGPSDPKTTVSTNENCEPKENSDPSLAIYLFDEYLSKAV